MQPFMKSYHFHYIKAQTKVLLNGLSSSSDPNVQRARKEIAIENVSRLFPEMSEEQRRLLHAIADVREQMDAKQYLAELEPYVIPFPAITGQMLKKLFPKAKKLKPPAAGDLNLHEASYVSWHDDGTQKKYIVVDFQGNLVGFAGTFTSMNQKGMCALCNRFEEIGMFIAEIKSAGDGTYVKRGNYICQDSHACNRNITSTDKLDEFVLMMRQGV
ncbi:FusB/FusC family EF-G-binding protein [Brevibacillus sp. GCM10020057]|uniref:FusB/FusC family EF-G-binding protein n=1 Tax=Brevibacillus sp. GCM10020057 TaxID=3317327 RepID=UPI0036329C08